MHIEYAEYAEYLPIVFLVQLELAIGHGPRWVCSMYVQCTYIEYALLVHEQGVSLGGGRAQPLPSMAKAELMLVDVDVDVI